MKENKYFKKIAKLQFKADKHRAKSNLFKAKRKLKKAGKFEGKAQHFESKIPKFGFKLRQISEDLNREIHSHKHSGNIAKAENLKHRVHKIELKLNEIFKIEEEKYPPQIVKEIIKTEMVRIPCNYCGTLNDITDKKCCSCGGSIGG